MKVLITWKLTVISMETTILYRKTFFIHRFWIFFFFLLMLKSFDSFTNIDSVNDSSLDKKPLA